MADRESRWLDTKTKQWAAQVIQHAKRNRCGVIAIGSYEAMKNPVQGARAKDEGDRTWLEKQVARYWRPAALVERIAHTARREGLAVAKVEDAPWSHTCADCGTVDKKIRTSPRWIDCHECGSRIDAEANAATNIARWGEMQYRESRGKAASGVV